MSGYPIQRDIVLRGDSASLVQQKNFHRRLELLFNVHVSVSTIENHHHSVASKLQYKDRSEGGELIVGSEESNGWVTVRGKSEEDCLKTQRYVLASSKPECKVLVPSGPQLLKLLFEDSPTLRDAIEREYEVVIIAALKDGGLYIHGSQPSVTAAVSRIHRLADTIPCPPKHYYRTNQSYHMLPPNLETDRNLINRDATCIANSLHTNTSQYQATSNHHQLHYSTQDTLLHKRVNQYVQLGFPVEQVKAVIESLGPTASENDVMSRLVLMKSAKPAPPLVVSSSLGLSKEGLRPIVIDGSNVAMKHGNGKVFSCRGIEIALNYFLGRGHSEITIFVPQWRKEPSRPETPIKDQDILFQLEASGYIKFTPSRRFGSRKIVCYDDRFIVQLAEDKGGIIVSDDNFRDLFDENSSWRETIEKRVLQFVFVEDSFMVPQDPLGKHGPRLDSFLRFERGVSPSKESNSDQHSIPKDKTPCPYKEKCTFGPRCRYYHPERDMKQREKEAAQQQQDDSGPKDQQEDLAARMNKLNVQPKVVHTHPIQYCDTSRERAGPGGLQNLHHTHPMVGHPSSSMMSNERESPYSHMSPHEQWGNGGSGRSREEHQVMGTIARGTDPYRPYPSNPMSLSQSRYSSSGVYSHPQSHVRPHSHNTHPQLVPPHLHPDYHHSHYSLQHQLSDHKAGYHPSSRPHSANLMGYPPQSYAQYKDPRELDQIQSLDSNQKLVYEKATEMFPQHRDRILALIVQFGITDIHVLIKALGK